MGQSFSTMSKRRAFIIGANALVTMGTKSRQAHWCSARPQNSQQLTLDEQTDIAAGMELRRNSEAVPRIFYDLSSKHSKHKRS